jgi:hypothetical protein
MQIFSILLPSVCTRCYDCVASMKRSIESPLQHLQQRSLIRALLFPRSPHQIPFWSSWSSFSRPKRRFHRQSYDCSFADIV